jgi:hypothetical protein
MTIEPFLAEHALSPWLEVADDYVMAPVDGGHETLPVRSLGDGRYEVCCVPFFVYDVDKGDVVTRDADSVFQGVSWKSGDVGFRFRSEADHETIAEVVEVLERAGAIVEFDPSGRVVCVNAADTIASTISGMLLSLEEQDVLEYETVRTAEVLPRADSH